MKKIFTFFLAMMMAMSLSMPAFAAGSTDGTITINGVSATGTYEIYKLLDLQSYNTEGGAYSYTVNEDWVEFFNTAAAKEYFTVGDNGYVSWTWTAPVFAPGTPIPDDAITTPEAAAAAFAKLALAYAQEKNKDSDPSNDIAIIKSSKNTGEFVITGTAGVFSNLEIGYYLVDSNVGALCGLTTTNPAAVINAKNGVPTVDKQVLEDSTNQWGAANTADIGQIVEYRATITVHEGAQNYKLHDEMEEGLTFEQAVYEETEGKAGDKILPNTSLEGSDDRELLLYPNSADNTMKNAFRGVWRIEHVIPGTSGGESKITLVPDSYFRLITDGSEKDADCAFEIHFTKEFCDHLKTNDKIIVHYNVMLNRHADIANEDDGNINKTWVSYGEVFNSVEDQVVTRTYAVDIVKTGKQNALIDGAKFRLYDSATGTGEVKVVPLVATECTDSEAALKDSTGNPLKYNYDADPEPEMFSHIESYRRARADESGVEIIVNKGEVRIVGLDNGTYYLEETEAPSGYNKLSARHPFTISDSNLDASFTDGIYSTGSGVHVQNLTGDMLPETGGTGKVLFITIGMIVALGTGVLLVTKKRMSMIR